MRKKVSIILGTLILFIWNAISWMALPFHSKTLHNIPEDAISVDNMRSNMTKSGVYHFPGFPETNSEEAMNEIEEKLETGPRITMMVYKDGPTKFFDPSRFGISLLINLLTVLLTFQVISKLSLTNTKSIILACITIGLIVALMSDVSLMNWYMFPMDYTLVNVMDKLIAFGLLGLLFAFYSFKSPQNA